MFPNAVRLSMIHNRLIKLFKPIQVKLTKLKIILLWIAIHNALLVSSLTQSAVHASTALVAVQTVQDMDSVAYV